MSTLVDRRAHHIPNDLPQAQLEPAWRDFALTLIFAAIGIAMVAAVLITGIPLTGPDIFAG